MACLPASVKTLLDVSQWPALELEGLSHSLASFLSRCINSGYVIHILYEIPYWRSENNNLLLEDFLMIKQDSVCFNTKLLPPPIIGE